VDFSASFFTEGRHSQSKFMDILCAKFYQNRRNNFFYFIMQNMVSTAPLFMKLARFSIILFISVLYQFWYNQLKNIKSMCRNLLMPLYKVWLLLADCHENYVCLTVFGKELYHISCKCYGSFSYWHKATDRQTDRQTDGHTWFEIKHSLVCLFLCMCFFVSIVLSKYTDSN